MTREEDTACFTLISQSGPRRRTPQGAAGGRAAADPRRSWRRKGELSGRPLDRWPASLLTTWKALAAALAQEAAVVQQRAGGRNPAAEKGHSAGRPPEGWPAGCGVPGNPLQRPPSPSPPREQPRLQPGRLSRSSVSSRCVSFPAPQGPRTPLPSDGQAESQVGPPACPVHCVLPVRASRVPAVPAGPQSDDTADVVTRPER